MTNRYLEESKDFYDLSEVALRSFVTLNAQLNVWAQSPKRTGDWILDWLQQSTKGIYEFKDEMVAAQKRLYGQL